MSNTSDPVECVGSLLVHSSDVQELSEEAALGNKGDTKNSIECVGSLVVPSTKMEELSESRSPEVNLKKRVTAVGTLLVPQSDDSEDSHPDQPAVESPSLVRRLTDSLQGPPPTDDSSPDTWAD